MSFDFPGINLYIFIIGACVGSFLNVCIYRIPENKSIISPGSSCPNCSKSIPFYLNIPILSYVFLSGRCKFCKTPISIRYPLIESLTGGIALLTFLWFGPTLSAVYWFVFICTLLTLSVIDMDHQIIPDVISLPGIIIFASSFYFIPDMTVKKTLIGIFAGGGSLYAVALFYSLIRNKEGMGGGDIKLLAMIGAAIGFKGVFFTIFAGSLIGTVAGIILMLYNQVADMQLKIPFGPFLSAGAVLYIFFGPDVIAWYFSLLGQ
ncbi:MAG: prepilin peptidase [Proteobacteria bacterium]|nr:prepilin peptidase [Pseudomonadota bacterium]MBU1389444.1 prepilin peptidase [Pseudomonadota bacterium]MBU1541264.1 prepilin peptidase [Pseudomonadota bacterium]MBU2430977.1 prepilin peptidase [Pseudomonadota bacterium]